MKKKSKVKEKLLEITILADTNDADYITSINRITESELTKIKPLITAIKKFKPYTAMTTDPTYKRPWSHYHNYPFGYRRDDLGEKTPQEIYSNIGEDIFEKFEELVPNGGDYGFHTIESIEVTPLVKKTKLL